VESLAKVKKELEQLKSERDQIIGRQKSLMERLNADFGIQSLEEAVAEIGKAEKELDQLSEEIVKLRNEYRAIV
jgi:uncharacterized protein YoxC